jgi:hypothetical protein
MNSVVGTAMRLVPAETTSGLAERLGATVSAVQVGIGLSVAVVLIRIANQASDTLSMIRIFDLIQAPKEEGEIALMLFGPQRQAVESLVAMRSGLGTVAGGELMATAAHFTMKALGQKVEDRGLDLSSFTTFVTVEAKKVRAIVPADLRKLVSGAVLPSGRVR